MVTRGRIIQINQSRENISGWPSCQAQVSRMEIVCQTREPLQSAQCMVFPLWAEGWWALMGSLARYMKNCQINT